MPARPKLAIAIGVLGAAAALLPFGAALEQELGLVALFELRGPVPPPAGVAVVAISRESAEAYGLPAHLREWPRRLHAGIVEALRAGNATAIVLDIAFESLRDASQDAQLAAAIDRAGNVVLLEQIWASAVELPGLSGTGRQLRQVPAEPMFAVPALGSGPFTLPTVPIRTSQFWVFGAGAGDGPTLPALAVQAGLIDAYPRFVGLLGAAAGDLPRELPVSRGALVAARELQAAMRMIRRAFEDDPQLAARLATELENATVSDADRNALDVLLGMYAGPRGRFLNFYGPSGTIETIPFHSLVGPDGEATAVPEVEGKVVFVGFSENEQSAQQDEFISVYSEPTGLSLSGVEIGATAFANLVGGTTITQLPRWLQSGLLLAWGVVLTLMLGHWRLVSGYAVAATMALAYLVGAVSLFGSFALWLPLVVPLGLQLPAALAADTLRRYRDLAVQRERLREALGPYAAPSVIARLARETTAAKRSARVVYGTCLLTDVAGYTSLAETMPPEALADLMNDYFSMLGTVVADHGGAVGDVSGDSMVGLWVAAAASNAISEQAVAAAIEIDRRVALFNRDRSLTALRTPIGLETGTVALSRDPQASTGPFRPVGDIVNTAARIQGLNRVLGTRLLISGAVQAALTATPCRRLGRFRLLGKRQALEVYEVLSVGDGPARADPEARFDAALAAYERGDLGEAREALMQVVAAVPADGPARFLLGQCERALAAGPQPDWDGTIVMLAK